MQFQCFKNFECKAGTVMVDASTGRSVRLFIHMLLIGADSQMRWIIGSVNPPTTGASSAFGHEISEECTQTCLKCNAARAQFHEARSYQQRNFAAAVDAVVQLQALPPASVVSEAILLLLSISCSTQEHMNLRRSLALHKAVGSNPLFRREIALHFNPFVQIPHDVLHCELLGISKKLAELVAASSPAVQQLLNRRIAALCDARVCKRFKIGAVARWNGRDLKQFIRVAMVLLPGVPGISEDLATCCILESQLLWFLTNLEWPMRL